MKKCALYIRVSTEDQREYSPDAQLKALISYAKFHDLIVDPTYIFVDEGLSGRLATKRPSFMRMIATAKQKPSPFQVILVHKFDRFARNREDSVVYKSLLKKECHVKVISITEHVEDDKFSVILESMLEAMAEYYSLNLSDEVKKGLFEKASRGEHIGILPFGYIKENDKIIPHSFDSTVVELIFSLCGHKKLSLSEVATYLNQHGFLTRQKKPWSIPSLKYILGNPFYTGIVRYNYRRGGTHLNDPNKWIMVDGTHDPLIDKELFEVCQTRLKLSSNSFHSMQNSSRLKSFLQHLLTCHYCGSPLTISVATGKKSYVSFRCPKGKKKDGSCSCSQSLSARKVENLLLDYFKTHFTVQTAHHLIPSTSAYDDEQVILSHQLIKINEQLRLAKHAFLEKVDTLIEYRHNKDRLLQAHREIEKRMETIQLNTDNLGTVKNSLPTYKGFYDVLVDTSLHPYEKNKFLKAFIHHITLDIPGNQLIIYYYH